MSVTLTAAPIRRLPLAVSISVSCGIRPTSTIRCGRARPSLSATIRSVPPRITLESGASCRRWTASRIEPGVWYSIAVSLRARVGSAAGLLHQLPESLRRDRDAVNTHAYGVVYGVADGGSGRV